MLFMFLGGWEDLGWLVGWVVDLGCVEIVGEVVNKFFRLVVMLFLLGFEVEIKLVLLVVVVVEVVEVVGVLVVVVGKGFVVVKN